MGVVLTKKRHKRTQYNCVYIVFFSCITELIKILEVNRDFILLTNNLNYRKVWYCRYGLRGEMLVALSTVPVTHRYPLL